MKKSAYSAAAVAVLGAGVALGQAGSGTKSEIVQIDMTSYGDVEGIGIGSGDNHAEAIANATTNALQGLAGDPSVAIDITMGDVGINDQLLSITDHPIPPRTVGCDITVVSLDPRPVPQIGYIATVKAILLNGWRSTQIYHWGPGA